MKYIDVVDGVAVIAIVIAVVGGGGGDEDIHMLIPMGKC